MTGVKSQQNVQQCKKVALMVTHMVPNDKREQSLCHAADQRHIEIGKQHLFEQQIEHDIDHVEDFIQPLESMIYVQNSKHETQQCM